MSNPFVEATKAELAADVSAEVQRIAYERIGQDLTPEQLGPRLSWTDESDTSQVWYLDKQPLARVTTSIESPSKTMPWMQQVCVRVERL